MFSCDNVITIPQYTGTCWFNSILMAIFYSQHSRKLFYHHFEGKKDKFSKIMNHIIKHKYIRDEEANKYFEFMRPENILRYTNLDKKELFEHFKGKKTYGFDVETFLPDFLKSLNKNVMDVIIYEKKCYANYYSVLPKFAINAKKRHNYKFLSKWSGINTKDISDPDYIIVHKIKKYNFYNYYTRLFIHDYNTYPDLQKLNLKKYNINIKGLITLKNEIFHNGNKYILDSILLNNSNEDELKIGHLVAGITCKNNRYVYNGWFRVTKDPNINEDFGPKKIPCELMKFDWNIKKDYKFCLNRKLCKLDKYEKKEKEHLCFSFNDIDNATLIYVKDISIKSIDSNLPPSSSSLTLPSLKSNSLSELIMQDKKKYLLEKKTRKKQQDIYKKLFKERLKGLKEPKELKNDYIDCLLVAFFNNKNLAIEELFFNGILTNRYAIIIRNEFRSYYKYKTIDKIKLLKAIQMYYNDFIKQNSEFPKIVWSKGKYYLPDLLILLQKIFKFDKFLLQILLSYDEKFKMIEKQEMTIKTIKITKLKSNPKSELNSLLLTAIITRQKDKYKCFYKYKTKWYDDNNKLIENIDNYIKSEKYKIVSYFYY